MVLYLVSSDRIVFKGKVCENDEATKACCQGQDVTDMDSFPLEEA